jgi:hypothetical protein
MRQGLNETMCHQHGKRQEMQAFEGFWQVHTAFAAYFAGTLSAADLDARLRKVAPEGTTEGSLFVPLEQVRMPTMG